MTKKVKPTKDDRLDQGAALIRQMQQRFAGFWQRLVAPGEGDGDDSAEYVQEYLNSLKERAYLERTIANQYRGRFLLELIQNAVDSMHRQANRRIARPKTDSASPYRCHLELTPEALYVANDGSGFEEADLRGICAMGQSTKPAGEYIGYKGLGFRAVLEITDTPEIYSGAYEFGFSRPETLALLETPGAPAGLSRAEVPILAVPHLRFAEELPEADREIVARLKKAGYATIIRLPLKQTHLYQEIRDNCEQLLSNHTLLFLPYITALKVALPGQAEAGVLITVEKTSRELSLRPFNLAETVRASRLNFRRSETTFPATKSRKASSTTAPAAPVQEDWLLIESRQPLAIESPELVTELEDPTWKQLKQVQMGLAFPLARLPWGGGEVFLKRRPDPLPFFAHFPTQEGSGLGLAVHADFYLSASRKQIEWNVPYNRWLAQQIVGFISGPALDAVHYLQPDEANLIEILLDYPYYNDQFGRNFREVLDNRLVSSPFIPVGNGRYLPPERVVWTPLGQEGVLLFRRVFRYLGSHLSYPVLQLEEVYTTDQPEPERELFAKNPRPDFDFEVDQWQTDSYSDTPAYNPAYDRADSPSYDYDPYDDSRYAHDPYSDNPDAYNEPVNPKSSIVNGSGPPSRQSSIDAGFDYRRIERFLSSLGVRKISPSRLAEIFPPSLEAWEAGVVLTGEICAVLALWYEALLKEGSGGQRVLLDQARRLPVLPTTEEGWQRPADHRFTFRDAPPVQRHNLDDQTILISESFRPLDGKASGQTVLYIDPEAYDQTEFAPLVQRWHALLGVRPAPK